MEEKPIHSAKADQNTTHLSPRTGIFTQIKQITAWVMILSAVLFALIGVMGIWQVFGNNTGDVVWRAFSSLLIIAFAALIINVASRAGEDKR